MNIWADAGGWKKGEGGGGKGRGGGGKGALSRGSSLLGSRERRGQSLRASEGGGGGGGVNNMAKEFVGQNSLTSVLRPRVALLQPTLALSVCVCVAVCCSVL